MRCCPKPWGEGMRTRSLMRKRPALWITAGALALLLLALALALRFILQPDRVAGFVLARLGNALGLEITAGRGSDYRLRGTPTLVVHDVVAREPGADTPLLQARRVFVSVPWSTVRSRGDRLDFTRIELDAPGLHLPQLRHWLAARPPAETRLPTLSDGLAVADGSVLGADWRIDGLDLSLPRLQAGKRVDARIAGRYRATDLSLQFNLAAAMTRPASDAGVALVGPVIARAADWRLPAHVRASGPLHIDDANVSIPRLRASISARYESGDTRLPFAFALSSPLRWRDGTLALAPAGFALRGDDVIPNLDASGAIARGKRLLLALDGRLADWPRGWPALPPPIGASDAPLPFALHYLGHGDLSDPASLRLRRDAVRFDARLRLPDVTPWIADGDQGSPLPPLSGHLSAPRLEISGAKLEGVEVEFDEPSLPAPGDAP